MLTNNGRKGGYHRRLHDWEPFDEVRIRIVPRYKTSGLSGDEWRQSAVVELLFKGDVVVEEWFNRMEYAVAFLPSIMVKSACPIPERVIDLDQTLCDQPSCKNQPITRYRVKRLTSERGEWLDPEEGSYGDHWRQFCAVHAERGDCSREDCDKNYEVISGPGPGGSVNVQESPSAAVVVDLSGTYDSDEPYDSGRIPDAESES